MSRRMSAIRKRPVGAEFEQAALTRHSRINRLRFQSLGKPRTAGGFWDGLAAKVSSGSGTASVSFEPPVSDEALTQAVESAGFEALDVRR